MTIDLTPGERAVLERALRLYMAHYQVLVGGEKNPGSKADLQNYITAAAALFDKLRLAAGLPV